MKFATAINQNGVEFVGIIKEEKIVHLSELEKSLYGTNTFPKDMISFIEAGESFLQRVSLLVEEAETKQMINEYSYFLTEIKILSPIPRPQKNIFCIGKNYRDHAIEMGSEKDIPTDLIVFTKAPTTVIASNDRIPNHQEVTNALDYEGELAIVIGKKGTKIRKEEASDYIFGYTIVNDVTARDIQSRHKQYFLGKSLDGTCPIGPWIVEKSEIEDPEALSIETRVNGEVRQQSSTKHFIFSIGEIIEILSKGMTLEPGDIIATGTPAGVGNGFKPPRFLQPNDIVEVTIEKVGVLVNQVSRN
ncbi:fumarylacetoacetate hydrolase family protein [Caldibacillus lycopersici]|uniref:Fumarylacetoacetate hydrolase family protein n=1 Tax=Perspicuibacillus lycopersici TaxID=1325689 RepID=A0AAE3IQ15_9BACI|nr:fumarylacetoacetate hydrolase family protein [Perspicuibacillus lycopersici]MCU9612470.1 fumarylacetoacetate hydrolase family protein [Perspicuibacillus lycopersici]